MAPLVDGLLALFPAAADDSHAIALFLRIGELMNLAHLSLTARPKGKGHRR